MFNIEMTDLLTLDIFTVLKVCWMTALAAAIVSIKPRDIFFFCRGRVSLVHENAQLVRDNALFLAVFVTLTAVLANLAVVGQLKFSIRNKESKVRTVN